MPWTNLRVSGEDQGEALGPEPSVRAQERLTQSASDRRPAVPIGRDGSGVHPDPHLLSPGEPLCSCAGTSRCIASATSSTRFLINCDLCLEPSQSI